MKVIKIIKIITIINHDVLYFSLRALWPCSHAVAYWSKQNGAKPNFTVTRKSKSEIWDKRTNVKIAEGKKIEPLCQRATSALLCEIINLCEYKCSKISINVWSALCSEAPKNCLNVRPKSSIAQDNHWCFKCSTPWFVITFVYKSDFS